MYSEYNIFCIVRRAQGFPEMKPAIHFRPSLISSRAVPFTYLQYCIPSTVYSSTGTVVLLLRFTFHMYWYAQTDVVVTTRPFGLFIKIDQHYGNNTTKQPLALKHRPLFLNPS